MKPTIDIDARSWQQAARDLFATSSRSLVDFTNGQALSVASRTIKLTEQANKAEIEHTLGQIGTAIKQVTRGKNAGKFKRSGRMLRDDAENTLAGRIVLKIYKETGKWFSRGAKDLASAAKAFIAMRVRTVSFIRSGWIPAIVKLGAVVRQKPLRASTSIAGAKQYGVPKGTARPAKNKTGLIVAEIENDIPGHVQGTNPVAERGLRAAMREATADMIQTLADRLKKDLKPFGAK